MCPFVQPLCWALFNECCWNLMGRWLVPMDAGAGRWPALARALRAYYCSSKSKVYKSKAERENSEFLGRDLGPSTRQFRHVLFHGRRCHGELWNRAAARCGRDGSTTPVERVPCPSRRPFFPSSNGPSNDGRDGRFNGSYKSTFHRDFHLGRDTLSCLPYIFAGSKQTVWVDFSSWKHENITVGSKGKLKFKFLPYPSRRPRRPSRRPSRPVKVSGRRKTAVESTAVAVTATGGSPTLELQAFARLSRREMPLSTSPLPSTSRTLPSRGPALSIVAGVSALSECCSSDIERLLLLKRLEMLQAVQAD
ncbi:hypothetical protein DFH09DRAFT_1081732 [Mycena vulgaris]|nr:hypothetical protein DFH09DRAFT_1081732 [Mycena vulgaris]